VGPTVTPDPFWEDPEVVERFASRSPDHRLQAIVEGCEDPTKLRVLDLGCAGGRNTVYLARRGVAVRAVDASEAMVARTRERLGPILGVDRAESRVHRGSMTHLAAFDDSSFDLVVALGVLHTAHSLVEWDAALAEIRRVLSPRGLALVSNFAPASRPEGRPLEPAQCEPHAYRWRANRPMVLMDARAHDASFAGHGFRPVDVTRTVKVVLEAGYRITVNALYEVD
jgi:SAM-dependent methyltransferase